MVGSLRNNEHSNYGRTVKVVSYGFGNVPTGSGGRDASFGKAFASAIARKNGEMKRASFKFILRLGGEPSWQIDVHPSCDIILNGRINHHMAVWILFCSQALAPGNLSS